MTTPTYAEYAKLATEQFGLTELYEQTTHELARATVSSALARHMEGIRRLLEMAHAVNMPDSLDPGIFEHLTFDCEGGWKVVIFYDDGDLDYIDQFITPKGEPIDFWEWSNDVPGRDILIAWQGREDTERLLALAGGQGNAS